MADKRAYFKVDVGYFDNPKVADLVEDEPRAVLLHLRAIAYCAQHLTDGRFPMRLVMRMACASQYDLQCLIKQFMVHILNPVIAIFYIQITALRVGVLCMKMPAVMIHRAFPDHCADGSFHPTPFSCVSR